MENCEKNHLLDHPAASRPSLSPRIDHGIIEGASQSVDRSNVEDLQFNVKLVENGTFWMVLFKKFLKNF